MHITTLLYTNNEHMEANIKHKVSFTINPKKNLGIRLKYVQDL